jgi:pimeloyl-ACP methyl ester carboxylesterase
MLGPAAGARRAAWGREEVAMPRVAVGDIELFYEVQGAGAPLLLIPGFGAGAATWQPELLAGLARAFRVVAYDPRGTGRSDRPDGPLAVTQLADDAGGLLSALGVSRAHVLGTSLGGYVAQELALRRPGAVDRLVLGCTHCGPPVRIPVPREALAPLLEQAGADPRAAIRRVWPVWYPPEFIAAHRDFLEAQLERMLAHPTPLATRQRQLAAIDGWSSHARLSRLAAPTLVLTGDRDALVVPENARLLQARIVGSRLHVIAGAGHLFWHSHPDEVLTVVTEFLAPPPAGGPAPRSGSEAQPPKPRSRGSGHRRRTGDQEQRF